MNTQIAETGATHEYHAQIAGLINLERRQLSNNVDWANLQALTGADVACAAGTMNVRRIYVPEPVTVTGVQYLVGSVGGTHKVIATLYTAAGTLLRASAAAGATVGTAALVQQVPFALDGALAAATTIALEPGYYWVGLTFEGTTPKFRAVLAANNVGTEIIGNGGLAQTFGTITSTITPPTTFTASKVPYAGTY